MKTDKVRPIMAKWDYELKIGTKLRNVIENSSDYKKIIRTIIDAYKELLDKGLIDNHDYSRYTEDIELLLSDVESGDYDSDTIEEEIDYELSDLYDLCDSIRVWIPIDGEHEDGIDYSEYGDLYKLNYYGEDFLLALEVGNYQHGGGIAIELIDVEEGDYFACLTVNIEPLEYGCAAVDTNNCPWAEKFIADNGLGRKTGQILRSGYCEYPVYKFNDKVIK